MEHVVTTESDLRTVVADELIKQLYRFSAHTALAGEPPTAWVSNSEAMKLLGLSRATLQRYRASGKLPYTKVGGCVYYRKADLAAFIEGRA